jgi:hypothetical protein
MRIQISGAARPFFGSPPRQIVPRTEVAKGQGQFRFQRHKTPVSMTCEGRFYGDVRDSIATRRQLLWTMFFTP